MYQLKMHVSQDYYQPFIFSLQVVLGLDYQDLGGGSMVEWLERRI